MCGVQKILTICLFQMTIHGRHDLKASCLNDLTTCSLIENLLQKHNTKIKFYFVVPSNVYKKKVCTKFPCNSGLLMVSVSSL